MRRAIDLAREQVRRRLGGPFGCVIVRGEEVVGEGANAVTSRCDPTAHAEVQAIRAACRRLGDFSLAGCELYTSCEPCPMCLGAIYWARIDRVYFGCTRADAAAIEFDDAHIYGELARPLEDRQIPFVPLLRAEALEAFTAWSDDPDRARY